MKRLTLAELSKKREDGRNACERLENAIGFLYKYVSIYDEITNMKYSRALWKRFRAIRSAEAYALHLWCIFNDECLYTERKLSLEAL